MATFCFPPFQILMDVTQKTIKNAMTNWSFIHQHFKLIIRIIIKTMFQCSFWKTCFSGVCVHLFLFSLMLPLHKPAHCVQWDTVNDTTLSYCTHKLTSWLTQHKKLYPGHSHTGTHTHPGLTTWCSLQLTHLSEVMSRKISHRVKG